jgi:hypothetical protein
MIQSNRVTIIPSDGAVYLDDGVFIEMDLSMCGIPENVHALQWLDGKGNIEYVQNIIPVLDITELPDWAIKCIEQWEIAYNLNPPQVF